MTSGALIVATLVSLLTVIGGVLFSSPPTVALGMLGTLGSAVVLAAVTVYAIITGRDV